MVSRENPGAPRLSNLPHFLRLCASRLCARHLVCLVCLGGGGQGWAPPAAPARGRRTPVPLFLPGRGHAVCFMLHVHATRCNDFLFTSQRSTLVGCGVGGFKACLLSRQSTRTRMGGRRRAVATRGKRKKPAPHTTTPTFSRGEAGGSETLGMRSGSALEPKWTHRKMINKSFYTFLLKPAF